MKKPKVTKKKWGGARNGSGPKPKDECNLKKPITIYATQNQLDSVGGIEVFKKRCYTILE